ncbi:MAG: MoaD/ThiS family protein [Egibacteraceae bacterium]
MVRVLLFAALREAAGGIAEEHVDPGPMTAMLDGLCDRYGERFRSRLAVASVLIDGTVVDRRADVEVSDGAEVALLPPVSGGVADRRGATG